MYINLDIFLPQYWVFKPICKSNKMLNGAFKTVNAFFNGLSKYRFIYQIGPCSPFRLNCNEYIYLVSWLLLIHLTRQVSFSVFLISLHFKHYHLARLAQSHIIYDKEFLKHAHTERRVGGKKKEVSENGGVFFFFFFFAVLLYKRIYLIPKGKIT